MSDKQAITPETESDTAGLHSSPVHGYTSVLWDQRFSVWFSCGAASAVAAKRAVEQYGDTHEVEVIYCDTLKYEHPDNVRFMDDVSNWIGQKIKVLKHKKYADIFEVFRGERYLVGPAGAPCTRLLKRQVRIDYASPLDQHVFGLTADEQKRITDFEKRNQQLYLDWILQEQGITKQDCYRIVMNAGIELPEMYKLGYNNNNCIGCVKGGTGYWNKIRQDFPEAFDRMVAMEREIGAKICKVKGERIWLSDLPKGIGRYKQEDIECGVLCVQAEEL